MSTTKTSAAKKLFDDFIGAMKPHATSWFQERYSEFVQSARGQRIMNRVCRSCLKPPFDEACVYLFTDTAACARCGNMTKPEDSVAVLEATL